MDDAGIEYILMLRTNFSKYDELADSVIDTIKSYKHELRDASRDYPGQKWFDNPETHLDKER